MQNVLPYKRRKWLSRGFSQTKPGWLKHLRMASVYTTTSHKIQAADTDLPIGSWWSFIAWDPSFSRTFLVHLVQLPSFSASNVIFGCLNQHFFMVQKNFQPEIIIFSRWLNQHFSGSFHGWYTSPFFQIKPDKKGRLRWPGQTFSLFFFAEYNWWLGAFHHLHRRARCHRSKALGRRRAVRRCSGGRGSAVRFLVRQWGMIFHDLGLSENSVALNPLDYHHFPYQNSYLGVYCIFRHTHLEVSEVMRPNHSKLQVYIYIYNV